MTTSAPAAVRSAELVNEYAAVSAQIDAQNREITVLNARLKPLTEAHRWAVEEVNRLVKHAKALRVEYSALTGNDLKKAARTPEKVALEQTMGQLMSAVGQPGNLPVTDPLVMRRFLAWVDAVRAYHAVKFGPEVEQQDDDAQEAA